MSDNPARVRMHIDLPAETWLEAFCFISRREVSNVVSYVGRHFYSIAHVRLHEQGKITLGQLRFTKDKNGQAEFSVRRRDQPKAMVPFSEVPMPGNIVGFERITIKFIDVQVRGMLHQMRRLFATVKCLWLDVDYDIDETEGSKQTVHMLREICPLLGAVNSIHSTFSRGIFDLKRISPTHLAGATSLFIDIFSTAHIPAICQWLTTANSGQARTHQKLLSIEFGVGTDGLAIMDRLKKEFLASTRPAPFFVGFFSNDQLLIGITKLHNLTTDEHLYIGGGPMRLSYSIVRYARGDVPDEMWAEWLDQQWDQLLAIINTVHTENQTVVVGVKKQEKSSGGRCCIL